MVRAMLRNKQAVIGLVIILLFSLAALFAPVLAPNDPNAVDVLLKFKPASAEFPLGTDGLGRCVLSRLLYGARHSLMIAVPSLAAIGVLGTILGTVAAFSGKIGERIFLWFCDVFMAFPPLVIAISLIGSFGASVNSILVAVFFSSWVWFARMVRTWARTEKSKDYITAAKIAGCGNCGVIFRHIIPNILPQCVVYLSTGVASVILLVSGFSFLGLGFPAGTAEWGAMLSEAKSYFFSHPELLIYPGLCILFAAIGFNLFGEALRDVISPEEVCE